MDLDGVIVDSFHIHVKGWMTIMQLLSGSSNESFCEDLRGVPTRRAIEMVLNRIEKNVSEGEMECLIRIKNAIRDIEIIKLSPSDLKPGITDFIRSVKRNNAILLCLATTKACPDIIRRIGFIDIFDYLIYGDKQYPPKSESSENLMKFLSDNNLKTKNCLFIDDGYNPVMLTAKSKIPSVWISNVGVPPPGAIRIESLDNIQINELFILANEKIKLR